MSNILEIKNLYKSFNDSEKPVIDNLNFTIKEGEILAIIGESGCGKTTLTRLITGLETPSSGEIKINNKIVSSETKFIAPEKRAVGLVFQDYALFPHLTVSKNISYGISKSKNKANRVTEMLDLIGLLGFEDRYPHQLSGGQQQRVALARALAPKPGLIIFDEPFSNLDGILREQLRNDIYSIIKSTGVAAIFVTHDTQDAIVMANKILILKEGKKIQKGTAKKLYKAPKNNYTASLFGNTIQFSKEDLSYFKTEINLNKEVIEYNSFAIRNSKIKINTNTDFSINTTINKGVFLGGYYTYNTKLPNNKVVHFSSKKRIKSSEIKLGFNNKNLLKFI